MKKSKKKHKKIHSAKHGMNQNCRGTIKKFRCDKKIGKEEWIREFFRRKLFILIFYLYSLFKLSFDEMIEDKWNYI